MLSLKGESTWGGLGSMNGNGVQELWVVPIMLVKHLGYEVKWEKQVQLEYVEDIHMECHMCS
jgi:hypothetical protein